MQQGMADYRHNDFRYSTLECSSWTFHATSFSP